MQEKPSLFIALSIMTLANGILNIIYGMRVTGFLPVVLGIFEILYATKLMADPPAPVEPSKTIAILEIANGVPGNALSLIVGILALVFYEDSDVKAYFAAINARRTSAS